MKRECQEPVWPFLCILASLFLLCAIWPRSWDETAQNSPRGSDGLPRDTGPLDPDEIAQGVTPVALPARIPNPPEPTFLPVGTHLSGKPMGSVPKLQRAKPALRLAGRPVDLDWNETPLASPRLPTPRDGVISGVSHGRPERPPSPTGPKSMPWPIDLNPRKREPAKMAAPLTAREPRLPRPATPFVWRGPWPEPVALFDQLEELAWECETGPWARWAARELRRLGQVTPEGSAANTVLVFRWLGTMNLAAEDLAESLGESPLAAAVRRAQHAIGRRLAIWSRVAECGGPGLPEGRLADDRARLSACLERVNAALGDTSTGRQWQEYLEIRSLERLVAQEVSADRQDDDSLTRRVVWRLTQPGMTEAQQTFSKTDALVELKAELRRLANRPVELKQTLWHMERYDQTGLPRDAQNLAADFARLARSSDPRHRELAQVFEGHFRNANVRLVVTETLLNRFVPEREPEYQPVRDRVLGKPVKGHSVTSSELAVAMIPDPRRARMGLEIEGLISARTESTSGPATFFSDSRSTYDAVKEIEIGLTGIRAEPAQVAVDGRVRLRSLRTTLDPVPLVGNVVRDIAKNQHQKSGPSVRREMAQKVSARARRKIDEETATRIDALNRRLKERVLDPLSGLALGPTLISAKTTDQRVTMRLRLASDDQLGSHTPRPRAPADSLVSCQMHESMINNTLENLDFDGGTFTLAEIRRRVAEAFSQPEILKELERDDVTLTFAPTDSICARFDEGRVAVTLSIASLQRSPRRWKNFQVRACYRPETSGCKLQLVRDGVIELMGRRLNTRSQIALRGIFSKTFSKNRPWELLPHTFVSNGRMAGLEVTQCEIIDGWVGIAFGPERHPRPNPPARPDVAERSRITARPDISERRGCVRR